MTAVDSETWTCRGCGAPMIGRRPAHDLCPDCVRASSGPYESERKAAASPAARAAHEAFGTGRGPGMTAANHRALCSAISAAGVDLGAWDHRIVMWLSSFEPSTVAVVAGLITRARAAGLEARP